MLNWLKSKYRYWKAKRNHARYCSDYVAHSGFFLPTSEAVDYHWIILTKYAKCPPKLRQTINGEYFGDSGQCIHGHGRTELEAWASFQMVKPLHWR